MEGISRRRGRGSEPSSGRAIYAARVSHPASVGDGAGAGQGEENQKGRGIRSSSSGGGGSNSRQWPEMRGEMER
jgi:hypothetical protein